MKTLHDIQRTNQIRQQAQQKPAERGVSQSISRQFTYDVCNE